MSATKLRRDGAPIRRLARGRSRCSPTRSATTCSTSLRNPRARFFTFFFPILLLVIFAGVFGTARRPSTASR